MTPNPIPPTPSDYAAFDARTYLNEYYAEVVPENRAQLAFLVSELARLPASFRLLEFGGGPCAYTLIAAARAAGPRVHAEYLDENRRELAAWLRGDADAFDWRATVRAVLELESARAEGEYSVTDGAVAERIARTRALSARVIACDVRAGHVLGEPADPFDVVVSHLCLEAASHTLEEWRVHLRRVVSLLKPGGTLLMTCVNRGYAYSVGAHVFPVLYLHEAEVRAAAEAADLDPHTLAITHTPADHAAYPYDGLLFVRALRRPAQERAD